MDARLLVKNPNIVLREEHDGYGLLYDPDTGGVRVANLTAVFVWKQCDGIRQVGQIVSALSEAFADVPADQVYGDVKGFVQEMVDAGFMCVVENPS